MLERKKHDASNISPYFGKEFITDSGSRYGIDKDGKIYGRASLEGYQVGLIGGFPDNRTGDLDIFDYKQLKKSIRRDSLEPCRGLALAILLTEKDFKRTGRTGIVTSLIDNIKPSQ